MTQQVLYDTASGDVIQWQDTETFGYPANPAGTATLAVTSAQWAAQGNGPWAVSGGVLVAATPPAPTLAQQAMLALAGGLTITSAGTPALNGTYAVDPATLDHIQAEMLAVQIVGTFADGATTVAWPDASGALHNFPSIAEYKAFALSVMAFVAACYKAINGSASTLPSASVTIA